MIIIDYIKSFIFEKAYIDLFPMADKGQEICDRINNCDFNEETELVTDINRLFRFILSNSALNEINSDTFTRNLNALYKSKRVKIKDEETGKKIVEKIKVERKVVGGKADRKKYDEQLTVLKNNSTELTELAEKIVEQRLEVTDLSLCDKILRENRISTRTYIALSVIIAVVIFLAFFL